MQIGILGPLEVRGDDGEPIGVAGARLRSLLTRLALDAGRPVAVSVLVDSVWGARPPSDEANALQTLVSRLRRLLGDAALIAQSPAGYRLALAAADVDAHRFVTAAAAGSAALRDGDPQRAVDCFDEALGLWRGAALADLGEPGEADAIRLHDQREAAQLERVDALLALGRTDGLAVELEARAAERPLDERLAGQLLQVLARTGRPAEALARYEQLRARLADELGVDPSPTLQAVHVAVLRGELAPQPDEPAVAAAAPRRTNLRAQLTSFVGRDEEVARIAKSLELNRLVTLVGPGGAGKTRLAGEAAARILDNIPDGAWLVELAPISDPANLPQAVLDSLGVREVHLLDRRSQLSVLDIRSRLLEALGDKDVVLVLDNCEHVVDASARLADELLAHCPRLRVLATSREPLGITGEVLLAVPPLGQPEPTAPPAEAMEYPAVRLFADRAAAVAPDLALDEAAMPTVIDIVRRLDGLPLAIELAAARLRSLPLAEIAVRLSDRFRLLTGGSRTAMPRHRTLRAVVEWSWDLLTAPERLLVERLAILPAGATVASATAICSGPGGPDGATVAPDDVADLLASLVDKSLLQPVDGGQGRVRMLETIREYGVERLDERGELATLRRRHADYFAALLVEAQPHLLTAGQLPWFGLLRAERDNIVAAIRFRADCGDIDGARRIAVALACFAMLLGNHGEIPLLLGDVRQPRGDDDGQLYWLTEALYTMNSVMGSAGEDDAKATAALARMQEVRDHLDLLDLGLNPLIGILKVAIATFSEDAERAERYVAEVLAAGHPWTVASVLMFRGSMAENNGDVAAMRADGDEALARFRELGERWGTASALRLVALVHTYDGDLDAAENAYVEALELMSALNTSDDEGFLRVRLAELRLRRGDLPGAREQIRLARLAVEHSGGAVESLFLMSMSAHVERVAGNLAEAERLHRLASERAAQLSPANPIGTHALAITMIMAATFALVDEDLAQARERLAAAYPVAVATRDLPIVASLGVGLADLTAREGDAAGAAHLLGAAAALRGADDPTASDIVRLNDRLRADLGDRAFERAYAAGKALGRDSALGALDPAGQLRRR